MVFAEATSVLPLIASDAYHNQEWKNRERKNFLKFLGNKLIYLSNKQGFLGIDNKFNFKKKQLFHLVWKKLLVMEGAQKMGLKKLLRRLIKLNYMMRN